MKIPHHEARLHTRYGEPVMLEGVRVSGDLRGLLFEASIEQRFSNPGDRNVEIVYTFPLPWAAVLLGVGLVTRTKAVGDEGDITALRDIEKRIEDELTRLEKMARHSENIRKNVDGISDEIRRAQKKLDLLLRNARSTLTALNTEVSDEAIEAKSPIARPQASFDAAVLAHPSSGEAA